MRVSQNKGYYKELMKDMRLIASSYGSFEEIEI